MNRVALIGENSIEYVEMLINIWNNEQCAVLIDYRIPSQAAISMMCEAGVERCYIQNKFLPLFLEMQSNIIFVTFESNTNIAALLQPHIYDKYRERYDNEEAVVIYSSGTTGKARGVILSHYAINTNADLIIDYLNLTKKDCIYLVKTIAHASCISGEVLVALKTKTSLLIAPIIVPPRYTLTNISKYHVTVMCVNPTLLQMYVNEYDQRKERYDLTSLKDIYVHGAKANNKLICEAKRVLEKISIYYEYGLTEAGPRVTSQKISSKSINSVGRPIKNVQIRIISDSCKDVIQNEFGIIHVQTPSHYSGYIAGDLKFKSLCGKSWINTGDVGYFDVNGELHIVGRVDDVIIINAHKIYPSEIETKILLHTEVKECAVIKVSYKEEEFIACVYVGSEEVVKIKKILSKHLMSFEIPRVFFKYEKLPRTLNGKISALLIPQSIQNDLEKKRYSL